MVKKMLRSGEQHIKREAISKKRKHKSIPRGTTKLRNKIATEKFNRVQQKIGQVEKRISKLIRYPMFMDQKNTVKSLLSKAISRFNTIPIKIPVAFFS